MAAEQALDFSIKLLEGKNALQVIALRGRALPYRGVSWEVQQRVKTTWYAGNPVATQQVMGPTESTTVIQGIWKDIFLGDGNARRLVDQIEGICRSGYLVEVTWGQPIITDTDGVFDMPADLAPITRQGMIKRFKPTYDRPQDIAWEIEFEWRGRADPAEPVVSAVYGTEDRFDALFDRMFAVSNALTFIREGVFANIVGIPDTVATALETGQANIDSAMSIINQASYTATQLGDISSPQFTYDTVMGVCEQSRESMRNIQTALESWSWATMAPTDYSLDMLSRRVEILDAQQANDDAMEEAYNLLKALESELDDAVIAEVRPIPGTDLRDLALRYYNDQDLWTIIADFNNLSESKVPALPTGPSDNSAKPIRIPSRRQRRAISVLKV